MKKTLQRILLVLLTLTMVLALTACQKPVEIQTQNPDGTLTVAGVLIEQVVTTVARLLEALVLAYGAWALEKFGKNKKLQNLSLANEKVVKLVKQTVRELNQTIVTQLKNKIETTKTKFICCGFGVGLSWGTVAFATESIVISKLVEVKEEA